MGVILSRTLSYPTRWLVTAVQPRSPAFRVDKKETRDVLERLRKALGCLDYRREGPRVIDRIVATFHGLIKRSGLVQSEAQMLKGLSRRICEKYPFVESEEIHDSDREGLPDRNTIPPEEFFS